MKVKFVLKDMASKTTLTFPVAPKELSVSVGTKIITYDHAMMGDSVIPRGSKPLQVSFGGVLPSKNVDTPKVENRSADSVIKRIQSWQKADRKRLRLIITGTPWNIDVFVDDFQVEYVGVLITYTISLTEYKNMNVSVIKAKKKPKPPPKRSPKPKPKPKPKVRWYTVKRGDNLWNIAKRYTGRGIRWKEMWAINKKRSRSKNANLIFPGEKFELPKKW